MPIKSSGGGKWKIDLWLESCVSANLGVVSCRIGSPKTRQKSCRVVSYLTLLVSCRVVSFFHSKKIFWYLASIYQMIQVLKRNEIMGAPKKTCLELLKTLSELDQWASWAGSVFKICFRLCFNTGWPKKNIFFAKKNGKGLIKRKVIHFINFSLVMG